MRFVICLLGLIGLSGVSGCAPPTPSKPAAAPAVANAGTILSMRAVSARAGDGPLRTALLIDGAAPRDASQKLVEFIVRADDGATLSIVQGNEAGFRTGDRVIIRRDEIARLARPG